MLQLSQMSFHDTAATYRTWTFCARAEFFVSMRWFQGLFEFQLSIFSKCSIHLFPCPLLDVDSTRFESQGSQPVTGVSFSRFRLE